MLYVSEKMYPKLPLYKEKTNCIKCCSVHYSYKEEYKETGSIGLPVEIIIRTCGYCGYVWVVKCADVKE